jgi:hypothetical protein
VSETGTQVRALIQRPASILDSVADRRVGYVQTWSDCGPDRKTVRKDSYELRRSEETHAYAVRWEVRTVHYDDWEAAL